MMVLLKNIRKIILQKLCLTLKSPEVVNTEKLTACLTLQLSKRSKSPTFILPWGCLNQADVPRTPKSDQHYSFCLNEDGLHVTVNRGHFTAATLNSILQETDRFGTTGDVHKYAHHKGHIKSIPQNQNILVEFSSPNIAKPFHAGHLRSTIIGNVISNIYMALGHDVTRINYLGDWGTQFGLLSVAYRKYGIQEKLEENSIKHLFEIYVKINKDVQEEKASLGVNIADTPTHTEGREFFRRMENGDEEALHLWNKFRMKSIEEYESMYKHLGVNFDVYEGESMYQTKSQDVIERLKEEHLLVLNEDTGVSYVDLTEFGTGKHLPASVLKSDGTTLYLTRDLAAAIARHEKYAFDQIHYVVENGQHLHFFQILHVLQKMGFSWTKECENFHVKFGRVEGMSTRRGDTVFLSDILEEAGQRMEQSMTERDTTRVSGEMLKQVADQLGVSAIIVQDLHASRLKNYKFSWDRMLNFKADSGVFLQYAHARLCSLEENCGVSLNPHCDTASLSEPEATRLAVQLAKYDEVLRNTMVNLEPYILVKYLCQLGHLINSANHKLTVKGEQESVAQARLLLFHCSRIVLANGLRLLGLKPIKKM